MTAKNAAFCLILGWLVSMGVVVSLYIAISQPVTLLDLIVPE